MNVWVVGSGGMVGRALFLELRRRQISAIGTSRMEVDVTDVGSIERFAMRHPEVTHVVNCAAYTKVDQAERESDVAFAVNAAGAAQVSRVASERGWHMMHLSTDYVFDGLSCVPYREEDPTGPVNVYGHSKLAGEQAVQGCIVRTSALFGSGGVHFVGAVVRKMQAGASLRVVADQQTCPTYVDDLVQALVGLLGQRGIYHVAGSTAVNWYQFACEIAAQLGISADIQPVSSREYGAAACRPLNSTLDCGRLRSVWGSMRSHREGLREFLMREYGALAH